MSDAELRGLAEAANHYCTKKNMVCEICGDYDVCQEKIKKYRKATMPAAIIELLDRVEKQERQIQGMRDCFNCLYENDCRDAGDVCGRWEWEWSE